MYQPKPPPFNPDVKTLAGYVSDELQSVAQAQSDTVDSMQLNVLHVAPKKPRKGMLALADGTDWDPGSGAGLYRRNEANDAWNYVGVSGPALRFKKLTGTTGAAEGDSVTVAHGLTSTKIINAAAQVWFAAGSAVPHGYAHDAGFEFHVAFNGTDVYIRNHPTNSENILSKAFTVLITYEE
jgi:hypothetical protein